MRHIGNSEQKFALPGVKFRDAFVRCLDLLRDLLHLRNQWIGALFFFFPACDFIARFVALCFALFIRGDQFAPLFVQRTKSIQVERNIAPLRHFGKNIEMFAKITQVMHGGRTGGSILRLEFEATE